jgi:hypothetical protein
MAEGAVAQSLLSGGEGGGNGGGDGGSAAQWAAGLDQDSRSWLDGKKLAGLEAEKVLPELVKGWRGAETKLGVPAEQLARLPKDENDADGWKAYLGKLGVPETPEGYELPKVEGAESEFPQQAAKWFHEMGVPTKIAKGITEKLLTYANSTAQAHEEKFNQQSEEDVKALKTEWKSDFDKNVELARRVRMTMGLTDQETQMIERTLGLKRAAMVFSSMGKALGEHRFHGGTEAQTRFAMSPESARSRIIDLQRDAKWMESYLGGDADKKAEWTRLHQIGFPDQPVQ